MVDDWWCKAWWDSHACSLPQGHDGPHICDPPFRNGAGGSCGSMHDGKFRIDGPGRG